jgi:FAD synthase
MRNVYGGPVLTRTLQGRVVHGDHRGRDLGFPTANVEVRGGEVPEDGVYQGWLEDEGVRRVAAISVGGRPTFYGDGGVRLVEVYVLDFDGDLYGHTVNVEVGELVRRQERFTSTDALVERMELDVAAVRRLSAPSG